MAGRGTDIKLEPASVESGGLYILGTERHESRRIDNQLRGRSGRQGDPGESRFYISLEDDLIRKFAGDTIKRNMQRMGMTEDEVIESKFISKRIEEAQEKVEKYNFDIREHLLKYDDVLNQQRIVVYKYRREILEGEAVYELIRDLIAASVKDIVLFHAPKRSVSQEQLAEIYKVISGMTGIETDRFLVERINSTNTDLLIDDLTKFLHAQYDLYRGHQVPEMMHQAEKWLMLESLDNAWKQHMLNLDHLKEGISFRSWGQKNPVIEYKKEGFAMFEDMMRTVRWEIVHHIFHLNLERFDTASLEQKRESELAELNLQGTSLPGEEAAAQHQHSHGHAHSHGGQEKIGRNDDCPCGSGKKYKKCCGAAKKA
jgi:preprotein translocase subunit SecA